MPYDNSGSGPLRVPGFSGFQIDADLYEDSVWHNEHAGMVYAYFLEGIEGWQGLRLTARELAMLGLIESITDKPDWDKKVFNGAIVDKWREEAMALPLISKAAWDWVLTEVRDKANSFQTTKRVLALDTNARSAKSDVLVSAELKTELIAGVAPLLSVPDEQKDWHPGSNGQVLNLVHPSLYPLVYGITRVLSQGGRVGLTDVLASCGQGEVAVAPGHDFEAEGSHAWSSRFQWLPCEVELAVGTRGETNVRITSYINNLHPTKHQGLYQTIEKIIGLSVPMWNDVIMQEEGTARTPLRIVTYGAEWTPAMPDWASYQNAPNKTTDPDFAETMTRIKEWIAQPDKPGNVHDDDEEDEYADDVHEDSNGEYEHSIGSQYSVPPEQDPSTMIASLQRKLARIERIGTSSYLDFKFLLLSVVERKWKRIRTVAHPEPGQSFTYEEWKQGVQRPLVSRDYTGSRNLWPRNVLLQESFQEHGLQVIVKLASIELTPDNPRYSGGSWHVEGMKNEHIVATSIYYYDAENTTPSYLSFRQGAYLPDMDLQYEQDDHEPLSTVFGTNGMRDEPAVQVIGRVQTPEGRLMAFPNTLQHKVEPFELVDANKPGHRRFLVMWLVDPHYRICSTRNVPPQQHSWWEEEAMEAVDFRRLGLPQELADMVKEEVGPWPMGLEEAKALRLELMAERTRMTESATHEGSFRTYNLCEH